MSTKVSSCCGDALIVNGKITHWYSCLSCNKPCDAVDQAPTGWNTTNPPTEADADSAGNILIALYEQGPKMPWLQVPR